MLKRLSNKELTNTFLSDLGEGCTVIGDSMKPLLISLSDSPEVVYKVYLYNCTNPPGGRTLDEYKIQLIVPGFKHGERGYLDESDGTVILIVGFAIYDTIETGVWVIWETNMHREFAYSANLQVKMGTLIETITKRVFTTTKRGNGEIIVVSDREHLRDAIKLRCAADVDRMLEE